MMKDDLSISVRSSYIFSPSNLQFRIGTVYFANFQPQLRTHGIGAPTDL